MPNPDTIKIESKERAINNLTTIFENFIIILNGSIKSDAEHITFEIVDQLYSEIKFKGVRFIVNFGKNAIIFEQKIGNDWNAMVVIPTIKNHFARGAPFHLVVMLHKNGMTINVNCNGPQNLNADHEIAFENLHLINVITGDYKYWNFSYEKTSEKSWMIEEGLSIKNSGGIMLKGKIDDNAKMFVIKFWHQKDDGIFESIFQLEVNIEPKYYKLSVGPNNKERETTVLSHSYNGGSQFEAIFKFNAYVDRTDIWMDNSLIGTLPIDPANVTANIVHFVQIIGDTTAQMTKIQKNRVYCSYEMPSNKSLKIVGKILPLDNVPFLAIHILFYKPQGSVHSYFALNISDHSTEIDIVEQDFGKVVNGESYQLSVPIEIGEIFQLDIHYKSEKQFGLTVNGEPENVYKAKNFLSSTKWFEIGANPDVVFILMKMDGTNCKQGNLDEITDE